MNNVWQLSRLNDPPEMRLWHPAASSLATSCLEQRVSRNRGRVYAIRLDFLKAMLERKTWRDVAIRHIIIIIIIIIIMKSKTGQNQKMSI